MMMIPKTKASYRIKLVETVIDVPGNDAVGSPHGIQNANVFTGLSIAVLR